MRRDPWATFIVGFIMFIVGVILGSNVQKTNDINEYILCLEEREFSIINVAGVPRDVTVTIDGCRITAKSLEE